MAKKYKVIDSCGTVHTRTTQNRTYTHCVVAHIKAKQQGTEPRYDITRMVQWALPVTDVGGVSPSSRFDGRQGLLPVMRSGAASAIIVYFHRG